MFYNKNRQCSCSKRIKKHIIDIMSDRVDVLFSKKVYLLFGYDATPTVTLYPDAYNSKGRFTILFKNAIPDINAFEKIMKDVVELTVIELEKEYLNKIGSDLQKSVIEHTKTYKRLNRIC